MKDTLLITKAQLMRAIQLALLGVCPYTTFWGKVTDGLWDALRKETNK